jgi:hypothetical protein
VSSTTSSTLLVLAASQSGFDLEQGDIDGWLAFASTHAPLRVWLRVADGQHLAALSQWNVARSLDAEGLGAPATMALPAGAVVARAVGDRQALHVLLRRAYRLSRTLPDELLAAFTKRTATMPRTTEAERLVVQRVGQDLFREGLLDYWEGRCALMGLAVGDLLRASHIKPWADCASDAERLDVFNGLLLAAHLDAAFDRGLVTFDEGGAIVFSGAFPVEARELLGLREGMRLRRVEARHQEYLVWHREQVFKGG